MVVVANSVVYVECSSGVIIDVSWGDIVYCLGVMSVDSGYIDCCLGW